MDLALGAALLTPRLVLRAWRADEAPVLLAMVGRPDVNRYLYTQPRTAEEIAPMLDRRVAGATLAVAGDVGFLAVERRADAVVVGEVLLILRSPEHRGAEFGAVFHPDFHGHGYAVEAGKALLAHGFAAGLHRIYARCDARNRASVALMARLGMRQEARFRSNEFVKGEWTDEIRCAVLASDFAQSLPSTAIVALEQALWHAKTRFDPAFMQRILAPDFREFGRSGRTYTREATLALTPGPLEATLSDVTVHDVAPDTALVTYVTVVRDEATNRSSLWQRTAAGWQLRFHQGTATDPPA